MPILCHEYGIPSPSLESVLKCEHKYWSRVEQQKIIPDFIPRFSSVDPFAENPLEQVDLDYPFWLKPVKAFSSQLGFKIENAEQFHAAIETTRARIHHFGDPFDEALAHVELPPEIRKANGNTCIAEEIIAGIQGAPEGSVYCGEFQVHGVSNHEIAIDVALGQRPSIPYREGLFPVAAKCIIPCYQDGIVTRVPSQQEMDALIKRFPGTLVRLDVEPGTRLSDLPNQNSLSYHIGTVCLGGESHKQVRERYLACST